MYIKTRFDVNNLVRHKFDNHGDKEKFAFEVMEIGSNTCYAGTQIFYTCRPIVVIKEFKVKYKEDGEFTWEVYHTSYKNNESGLERLREDELVELEQETVDIILGAIK